MLLEHIHHYNNLHFSMKFTNVSQEAPHYHKEMELVLMLRGHARYKVHHQDYYINTGDIFVVDTQDLHYIYESSDDVIMLQFHVDMGHFTDIYPNIDVMFFVCEETDNESVKWHQRMHNKIAFLSHHIAEMMMLCQKGNNDKILEDKLREFLYIMVDKFQAFYIENNEFHHGNEDIDPLDLERLYRIMHYLYANFDKKVTLSDIASEEHLSIHYISHFIKKTSGLSFQNLLNYIRVEQADKLLNENRLTLTQISEFCGFSSPAYFNKCFASWFGISPSEYRKQYRPRQRAYHGQINNSEALVLLQSYLNTDLPDSNDLEGGYSINHLIIPISEYDENQKDFECCFPVNIMIDTDGSLLKSAYYIQELTKISPNKLLITKNAVSDLESTDHIIDHLKKNGFEPVYSDIKELSLRKYPAKTTAAAFAEMMDSPEMYIKLFDNDCGLLTEKGLPTPYYVAAEILSEIQGIPAMHHEKYILVRNNEESILLIHNHKGTSDLNVHIQFDPSSVPSAFMQQIYPSEANIYETLDLFDNPGLINSNLKKYIWEHVTNANTTFIPKEALKHFRLNITIKPDTFIVLHMF